MGFESARFWSSAQQLNPLPTSVAFYICTVNQMTGFYMNCNTRLIWTDTRSYSAEKSFFYNNWITETIWQIMKAKIIPITHKRKKVLCQLQWSGSSYVKHNKSFLNYSQLLYVIFCTSSFLTFSGGIKRDQCYEMDQLTSEKIFKWYSTLSQCIDAWRSSSNIFKSIWHLLEFVIVYRELSTKKHCRELKISNKQLESSSSVYSCNGLRSYLSAFLYNYLFFCFSQGLWQRLNFWKQFHSITWNSTTYGTLYD